VLAHSLLPPLDQVMEDVTFSSTDALKKQMVGMMTPFSSAELTQVRLLFRVSSTHGITLALNVLATQLNVKTRLFLP